MADTDGVTPSAPQATTTTRRRAFLGAAAAGAAGIGAGATGALALHGDGDQQSSSASPQPSAPETFGAATVPFHGAHQPGLSETPGAHAVFISLTLNSDTDRGALERLLRILSDDAARLMGGAGPLADVEPELAANPASLTVTFGVGEKAVAIAGAIKPTWLRPLPAFEIDKLEDAYSGGDLLIAVQSNDPIALAHAQRLLLRDSKAFASIHWIQKGFRNAHQAMRPGKTQRNLFGQVDGTVNPLGDDFDACVWINKGWLAGGTSMVIRRIAMNLDTWDQVDRVGREFAIGRKLETGAPLTGTYEGDEPDFAAKDGHGFPVIDTHAHVRRARLTESPNEKPEQRIVRRPFNYDDPPTDGTLSNTGLIFVALQKDVDAQYVPLQKRLADGDLLNTWTTPIGSAVFAILPGCSKDGFVGETLFH